MNELLKQRFCLRQKEFATEALKHRIEPVFFRASVFLWQIPSCAATSSLFLRSSLWELNYLRSIEKTDHPNYKLGGLAF